MSTDTEIPDTQKMPLNLNEISYMYEQIHDANIKLMQMTLSVNHNLADLYKSDPNKYSSLLSLVESLARALNDNNTQIQKATNTVLESIAERTQNASSGKS